MARPLRIEFPGAIYHLTSRGNAREPIYRDDGDRERFLDTLAETVDRHRWRCHAYCLMGNHYHLVIETPEGGLSRGMRELNGRYSQSFNRRHERVGHLLQGRFHAIVVDREAYFLEVCRYVVLNPVRAGLVTRVGDWPWSSYRATSGLATRPRWLTTADLLAHWGASRTASEERFAAFVRDGIRADSPWRDVRGGLLLGSDAFVEKIRPALLERADDREIPKAERTADRPPLQAILRGHVARRGDKRERNRAVRTAYLAHRYTLSEIGRAMGVHAATVWRIVNRPPRQDAKSKT